MEVLIVSFQVMTELQLAKEWTQKLSELGLGKELKGLSSGLYNLGVQLFNQHRYDLVSFGYLL